LPNLLQFLLFLALSSITLTTQLILQTINKVMSHPFSPTKLTAAPKDDYSYEGSVLLEAQIHHFPKDFNKRNIIPTENLPFSKVNILQPLQPNVYSEQFVKTYILNTNKWKPSQDNNEMKKHSNL